MKGDNYMNQEQMDRIQAGKGFIAALDQSGGSTPTALLQYGISKDCYSNDEAMFNLVHDMRTRIIDVCQEGCRIKFYIRYSYNVFQNFQSI